ncbi:MAG: TldD/PmbA family protein [Pseudomonadota bacterium]
MDALKKERKQLEEAASRLISEARRAGADSAEVCASFGHRNKIALEKQDYHLASSDEGYQLGLRILTGHKQGFASTNSIESNDLKQVALRAVEIGKLSPENPFFTIQSSPPEKTHPPVALWDSALSNTSLQTQKDWIEWMRQEFLKDSRIRLNEGSLEVGKSLSLLVNSKGTHQLEAETSCTWSLMGMALDKDLLTSFDYFSHLSRKALGVGDIIIKSTSRFRDSLLKNLRIGEGRSYKGLVFFSPRAVLDVLLDSLTYHLNGRVLLDGSSRWKLEDKEKPLLNSQLTLIDTAWLSDRFSCGLFDREGTPTEELELLYRGHLKNFLLDNYSGKGLHQSSNGHAVGSATSTPTVGTHSLCLRGGDKSLQMLMRESDPTSQGILWINRYSGQTDPVTGDFSGVAKGSEWWVNGEFRYCVTETLISGNVFDCLGRHLIGLSSETQVIDSSGESPSALVDGVSVTTV